MLKYISMLLISLVLTGCQTLPAPEVQKLYDRIDNLESEVIALRAENHVMADYLGLYDEEYEENYELVEEELSDLK